MKKVLNLKIKRLSKKATLPSYAHEGDVGMDVKAIGLSYDAENDAYVYDTGLACETSTICAGYCFPKSRNFKTEGYLTNAVGIVDSKTYRGEIKVIFKNRTSRTMMVLAAAMERYDELPWYKKLTPGRFMKCFNECEHEFLNNPLKYAPYSIDDAVFQLVLTEIVPVQVTEVSKLSSTKRGKGGFGSTKQTGN